MKQDLSVSVNLRSSMVEIEAYCSTRVERSLVSFHSYWASVASTCSASILRPCDLVVNTVVANVSWKMRDCATSKVSTRNYTLPLWADRGSSPNNYQEEVLATAIYSCRQHVCRRCLTLHARGEPSHVESIRSVTLCLLNGVVSCRRLGGCAITPTNVLYDDVGYQLFPCLKINVFYVLAISAKCNARLNCACRTICLKSLP